MRIGYKTGWMGLLVLMLGMSGGCGSYGKAVHRPFNGRNLDGWTYHGDASKSKWTVGRAEISKTDPKQLVVKPGHGEMINVATHHGDSVDIYTVDRYGDSHIEVDLMVPQKSNSGIYVMGEYEVQVLDSWGVKEMKASDIGAIYGAAVPKVNASRPPGEWQHFDIVTDSIINDCQRTEDEAAIDGESTEYIAGRIGKE